MVSLVGHSALARTLLVIGLSTTAQGQFFTVGHNALTRTRLDPIVSYGKIASHTHVFAGTNLIHSTMDHNSSVGAGCTTSPVSADKSGYWAPQLYYKWENGTYSAISGDGLITYWLNRGNDVSKGEKSVVVPDDFRMVAGNTTRDFLDVGIPSHAAVSFQCFGRGADGVDYDHKFPYIPADFECEQIRPQIIFPNCWNEVDSYKDDNSHVAYPTGNAESGPCPAGFKRMPTLFMEAYYKPRLSLGPEYKWYPGCLVLSNGDNFGLTYHADWLNGFPSGLLNEAFDKCPTMAADPSTCSVLAPFMQTKEQVNCEVDAKSFIVNEAVGIQTPLAKLPGNNAEFNSSKIANQPKHVDASYVESRSLFGVDKVTGGTCHSQRCTDFMGSAGDPVDPSVSASASSSSSIIPSSSVGSAIASSVAIPSTTSHSAGSGSPAVSVVSTPTTSASKIGAELNAGPMSSASVAASGCSKRSKRRLPHGQ